MKTRKETHFYSLAWLLLITLVMGGINIARGEKELTLRLYDSNDIVAGSYTSFCKDKDGFVWIGTDSGLLCFDGNHIDAYRNDERDSLSLSDNKVSCLFCDSRGNLWIGTTSGLNYYDRNSDTFRHVALSGLNLNGFIGDITELKDGRLLFVVGGVGFFTLTPSQITDINEEPLVAQSLNLSHKVDRYISNICKLSDESLVFTTRTGEIYMVFEGGLKLLVDEPAKLSFIEIENDNTLIVTSQYEVFRLNLNSQKLNQLIVQGDKRLKITGISHNGNTTYFATASSGVWELRDGESVVVPSDDFYSSSLNLRSLKVGTIHTDDDGNIWLGCNQKGVAVAPSKETPFVYRSLNKLLQEEDLGEIKGMAVVGNNIVVGLTTGILFVLDANGSVIQRIDVPRHSQVTSVVAYSSERALIGLARDGIWSLDLTKMSLQPMLTIDSSYPGVIMSIIPNGDILAAFSEKGVVRYNPTTGEKRWFSPDHASDQLPTFYYSGIVTMPDGKVWIGGYSGLACFDSAKNEFLKIDQTPFVNGVVHDICESNDGSLMLATGKGIVKYSPEAGVIKKYSILEGLADNDVRSLIRDSKGGLWIGTLRGLSYMSPKEERIHSFGSSLGLPQKAYSYSDCYPLTSRLVLGGYDGIGFFNPDSVSFSDFRGDIRITGISLNGKRITPATLLSDNKPIIEGNRYMPSKVRLDYNESSLVLQLSTMDFRDASEVRYEWQIDGEHDKWHSTSLGDSYLYLPPMKPGKHKLRLRGWENDVYSDTFELVLDVKAPWYMSNTAYIIYVLIGIMIIALMYKVIKNRREEELYEARIKYFIDISHEIRSPIMLLLSPVEALLKQPQTPQTTTQLLTVKRNAQRVLNLADQLLDIRKIEKGKMKLKYTPTELYSFVDELVEMFRPQAEEKGLKIEFRCDEKNIQAQVDRNNLDKILVNLISNAIKYTPKGGEVLVELSLKDNSEGNFYEIKVTDTGVGLDNKLIKHLFERFYRGESVQQSSIQGYGIGLDLCMRLVALHGGKITGNNREDGKKGSVFTVLLPYLPATGKVETETALLPENEAEGNNNKEKRVPFLSTGALNPMTEEEKSRRAPRNYVMIIDDDAELREYIKQNLGAGYKIKTFSGAKEALNALAEKQPDIIITDIRMDGMDGFELLRILKSDVSTHHIPVILFSSANEVAARTKGWRSGADGFVSKPFSINELDEMIKGLLANRQKLKGKFSGTQDKTGNIELPALKGVDAELMERVDKCINDNISEPELSVDKLSDYVGLSRSQLHRRMKEIVGISPSDYIRNIKLKSACEMLRNSDIDISQVAYSLGFNAQSHFSTLFKRFTGLTPSEYRQRETNRIQK